MDFVFTIYTLIYATTTLVAWLVAFLAWQRRLVKGARELTILMIAAGAWAFWIIFESGVTSMPDKIFWSKLEYFGAVSTPVFYLIFVLRFTGKDKFISAKHVALLFIVPVITLMVGFTNEKHYLLWSGFSSISEKTNLMEYYHGIWFWIGYLGYNTVLEFLATIYLFSFITRHRKTFRFQGWIIVAAGLSPWIASVMYLRGINFVPGLDLTPVSIILSGTLLVFAIFYNRFLDLIPVARETLFETLTDGILAIDELNRIQDINKTAATFLGIENKNIIGLPAESSGATVVPLLNAVISQESIAQIDTPTENGVKSFRIIKREIKNHPASRLIIIRDITEQVTWQKEIQAGEERYRNMYALFRLIADNTDDFLWAKDTENKYIFCNKTICERLLVAQSVDEPIGKNDLFFAKRERDAHPDSPDWHTFGEICADTDTITIKEGKAKQFDEYGNVKGKFLFLDVHKAPIWDEQGRLVGIVGTARDITLTKQLENEKTVTMESLQKSEDNLRKINAEKDKFFSIIAHDLRSPFSSFIGLTQIMAEELPNLTMAEVQDIVLSLKNSATNLFRLLENLLNWARMKQGLIPFIPVKMPLNQIIKEGIEMMLESAKIKEIEITKDIPELMEVFADHNILETVIRNLVSNAIKFTPKGGKVHIRASQVSDRMIEISVKDTGIGMNQTLINNLFRLDVQTNRKGTDDEPSTGLGLLLCKEFIEKQGGTIRIESEVGKGSTFYFTLPAKENLELQHEMGL